MIGIIMERPTYTDDMHNRTQRPPDLRVPYPMKAQMLIITNVGHWILGDIARRIASQVNDDYEVLIATEWTLHRRPDIFHTLLETSDVILAMTPACAVQALQTTCNNLPALVTWFHHVTHWSDAHKLAAEGSRHIIVTTAAWGRELTRHGVPQKKISVVPYGVDTSVFSRMPKARKVFGMPANAFVVGVVCSKASDKDSARKGIDTLLSLIQNVHHKLPTLHVCFTGSDWDTELSYIRKLGVSANKTGFLPSMQLPKFYSSLDVYLMTARVEGGPCTVMEAMACETPVVATRVGMVPDLIRDGVNGYSTEPDDMAALSGALLQVASSKPHARLLGTEARATVEGQFTWEHTIDLLSPLLKSGQPAHCFKHRSKLMSPSIFNRSVRAADVLLYLADNLRHHRIPLSDAWVIFKSALHETGIMGIPYGLRLLIKPSSCIQEHLQAPATKGRT